MEGIKAQESFDPPIPVMAGFCSFLGFNSAELWLRARIRKYEILKLLGGLNAECLLESSSTQRTCIVLCNFEI